MAETELARLLDQARQHYDARDSRSALAALDQAKRLAPADADIHHQRALALEGLKQTEPALEAAARAVKLQPKEPLHLELRARLLAGTGRIAEACRALDAAVKLAPERQQSHLQRIALLAAGGKTAAARRVLAEAARAGGQWWEDALRFWNGYLELKSGRAQAAAVLFDQDAARPQAPGPQARADAYAGLARALPAVGGKKAKGPRLFICGLGIQPPLHATVETLSALRRSDVIFNNAGSAEPDGVEILPFLGLFCDDVRPTQYGQQVKPWADMVMAELAKGARNVAFVTRGHPLLFGGLGWELMRRCEKAGIPFEVPGAVSSIDVFLSGSGLTLGHDVRGVQAFQAGALAEAPAPQIDPAYPLFIYFYKPDDASVVPGLCRFLLARYPQDQKVWLRLLEEEAQARVLPLSGLENALKKVPPHRLHAHNLLVPPKGLIPRR